MIVSLSTLQQFASSRKPGYVEAVISIAKPLGDDNYELTPEQVAQISAEYRLPEGQQPTAPQTLPSSWQMFKNVVSAVGDVIKEGADLRSQQEIDAIIPICMTCHKLVNDNGKFRCGDCGCFLGGQSGQGILGTDLGKISLRAWRCPLHKW